MPQLSHRVQTFTDSVIRRMTRINNQQPGSINLSQGFPDFDPPREITDALAQAAESGPHQYAITFGAPNFRAAIADKYSPTFGRTIDPDHEVLVTCGSTEAMMAAVLTVCNPGDKIIVFSPFYENYGADAILSGAEPIFVPLIPPTFHFDRDVLENAFRQGAKALILCNPSNPCGKVFTREELTFIGELALKYDAFIITDEVYEHIIFEDAVHTPMASLPGMWERTITCNSLSKTYSITGWRLGFIIGPAEVVECAKKVHDFLTVGAAAPLQEAACTGLRFPPEYYQWLKELYTKKRDVLCSGLEAQGWTFTRPQGSYFVLLDISDFLALEQFKGWTDLEFCVWMIREVGVAAVPGSSFFREPVNHLIRLHFARSEDVLQEAVRRMGKLREMLK
ncbi:MAG: pyridoxal phosphate-dependent aminotransferase [Oscillospiraceae bacterium]|nr:pyridoxal phosphate-dependent aminotransferase [Oscillospiraceae bacterium]